MRTSTPSATQIEIRPALTGQHEETAIHKTFNTFFGANIVSEMVRQWTVNDGPFNYDYFWLTDTMPLRVEKLFQEYNQPAAFALASLLTMLAMVTLIIKVAVERRLRAQMQQTQHERAE